MKTLSKLSAFFVGLLMLLAAFSPAFALTSAITAPNMVVARSSGSSWSSTNWSGYAVTGATNSVTSASGSWTVPTASPGTSGTTAYYRRSGLALTASVRALSNRQAQCLKL